MITNRFNRCSNYPLLHPSCSIKLNENKKIYFIRKKMLKIISHLPTHQCKSRLICPESLSHCHTCCRQLMIVILFSDVLRLIVLSYLCHPLSPLPPLVLLRRLKHHVPVTALSLQLLLLPNWFARPGCLFSILCPQVTNRNRTRQGAWYWF